MDETGFVPLPKGAFSYIFADVPQAMPILNYLSFFDASDKQLQQMIEKTHYAVAAAYSVPASPEEERRNPVRYQLIAWGKYPASGAKMALDASKGWKKYRSRASKAQYWNSLDSGLSLAINPAQVYVTAAWKSQDTPIEPFPPVPGVEIPEGFNATREGSLVSCWIARPASFLYQKMAEMGIPLEIPAEQLFISLYPASEDSIEQEYYLDEPQYEARLKIEVSSPTQARGLTALFSIARGILALIPEAKGEKDEAALLMSMLFANPPTQDGSSLNIKTPPLGGEEIALLFRMFSL